MQPGHSKANEEATLPSPSTPEGVRGASELQEEAEGEAEEYVCPWNTDESEQADKVIQKTPFGKPPSLRETPQAR